MLSIEWTDDCIYSYKARRGNSMTDWLTQWHKHYEALPNAWPSTPQSTYYLNESSWYLRTFRIISKTAFFILLIIKYSTELYTWLVWLKFQNKTREYFICCLEAKLMKLSLFKCCSKINVHKGTKTLIYAWKTFCNVTLWCKQPQEKISLWKKEP